MNEGLPVIVILIGILVTSSIFAWTIYFWAGRYRKIPPNQLMIIYGRKNINPVTGKEIGYRGLKGGGTFVFPLVENFKVYSTDIMSLNIENIEIMDKHNMNLTADIHCQIIYDDNIISNTVDYVFDKSREQIENNLRDILKKHLQICSGEISYEEIIHNRNNFIRQIEGNLKNDLASMGMKLFLLNLKKITKHQV
jgi:flotillin